MEFRILGSFEAVGSAGSVDVRGAKRRGLLACLLVHAGQPLSTDRLVEELWGDAGSDGAARTVQTYVSQLRKLLDGEAAPLVTGPGGYALAVDPGDVDASRFERAVAAAGAEPDPLRRLTLLDGALGLWRGPPLGEFAGAGWADREATRLEALYVQALQRRYDALLELSRAGEAAAELELTVRAYPLDEGFAAQFMMALYRCGRQADALGAYQQTRHHLVDELGIEPGPELTELEHRILDHDPTLRVADSVAASRERSTTSRGNASGWRPRTFLLTDIVDSVSLWERDAETMSAAVARHDALIQDTVGPAGGELVRIKGEGESTFSAFVDPSDALAAVAAIQQALASEPWPSPTRLRVRAGVHTGEAEPRNGAWLGPAVNRTGRLRSLADGGQILVSGVTAGLVADRPPENTRLLYVGRRALRGIERPEEVWELVAADDSRLAASTAAKIEGLPISLTNFVGRAAELDQLGRLIDDERLVTLTGPGGAGKTRLALEAARHAARRGQTVWLAELAPLRDGGLVAQAVASAVGAGVGPDPLEDILAQPEALTGLLVLDNCEHLLDVCAVLIERLLAACPHLRVLATSRESLGLAGERECPVRPLDVPDESLRKRERLVQVESVQLLLDRARAVRPDLEVGDDDVASIVGICRALDGIPLAIELAAGRLRSLSLPGLEARLGDQLTVLARHRPAGRDEARHRTLRMTLDWSYNLLTDDQQALARRLSVFAGGFRLDAAEAVCGDNIDVLDGIDELVAKSLVTFDTTTARYRLLEPIRQYLAERLDEAGEAGGIQQAHAHWMAGLCHRLGKQLLNDQKAHSRRLGEETANIDLALQWAHDHDRPMAMGIVAALGQYWFLHDQANGRRWCLTMTEAGGLPTFPKRWAGVLQTAGMIAQSDEAWDRAISCLRQALSIYRAEQAVAGQAWSLFWLGRALANSEDHSSGEDDTLEATRCLEECLELATQLCDWVGIGWSRALLSSVALWNDDLDRAENLANQVIKDCSSADVWHPMGQALANLAIVAFKRGDNDAALNFLHGAVAVYRDLNDPWQLAGVLVDLAAQATLMGRGAEALQALAESSQLDEQTGRLPGRSFNLALAACIYLTGGQLAMAISALGAYDAHSVGAKSWGRPGAGGAASGYYRWLAEAVSATRARLDPAAVAAATATARTRPIDELIDELISQPAKAAATPP